MQLQWSAHSDQLEVSQSLVESCLSTIVAWLTVVATNVNWTAERAYSLTTMNCTCIFELHEHCLQSCSTAFSVGAFDWRSINFCSAKTCYGRWVSSEFVTRHTDNINSWHQNMPTAATGEITKSQKHNENQILHFKGAHEIMNELYVLEGIWGPYHLSINQRTNVVISICMQTVFIESS